MRKFKEVILDGIEPIRMQEMTVSHVPAILRILKKAVESGGELSISDGVEMVLDHYDEAIHILRDCSNLTEGVNDRIWMATFW